MGQRESVHGRIKTRESVPNGPDPEKLRGIIVAEIAQQMQPVMEELRASREWRLGFWSNGSKDRPPGFFQMRIKADDERHDRLAEAVAEQKEISCRLDKYVQAQLDKIDRSKQRWATWGPVLKWGSGLLSIAVVSFCAWAGPHISHAAQIIWDDYLREHPQVTKQLKNVGDDVQPAYNGVKSPSEHSGIDPSQGH